MEGIILTDNKTELAKQVFDSLDISELTRQDYKYRVGLFLEFIKDQPLNFNTFLEFKRYLEGREDFTTSTKNKYLATAKVFLKEANKRGFLPTDITQNVKGFKQNKKHKRDGMTKKEILNLVDYLNGLEDTPLNIRLKAMFCLLTLQGLRQIEIIRLNVEDLNLSQKIAFIRGKGSDDKEVIHLHPETVKALKKHIKANKVGSRALFRSLANRKSTRLTTRTIKNEIKRVLEPLNIEKTTHGFRHYYVTTLLESLDVRDVRKFSRHKGLEMLIVYDDEIDIKHKSKEVFNCFKSINLAL